MALDALPETAELHVPLPAHELTVRPSRRRAEIVVDPTTGEIGRRCSRTDCPHVVHNRGSTLCAGHWRVWWDDLTKAVRCAFLRRWRRHRRERERKQREAKRVAARQMDRTEGRRRRRATHGALTRQQE